MFLQSNFAQSFQSPFIRIIVAVIALGLLYILWREVRKIPAKLMTLMATAFLDMVGVLMIFPLLPFYVQQFGGEGINILGFNLGVGFIAGFIISSFTVAQLISAPMWGRFSDRVGRRPTLIIALTASGIAYLIFGFANSLFLLFLSRIVQGAGGGTVGVIQAYVADSTAPQDRTRALGWLSATTNLGVALGPVLGSFAITLGKRDRSLVQRRSKWETRRRASSRRYCVLSTSLLRRAISRSREMRPNTRRLKVRSNERHARSSGA